MHLLLVIHYSNCQRRIQGFILGVMAVGPEKGALVPTQNGIWGIIPRKCSKFDVEICAF